MSNPTYFYQNESACSDVVRKVSEDTLDDTTPTAVVETSGLGFATTAELDQFYHKDGFFRLECSNELPPVVLARALLAAYRAVAEDLDYHVGGVEPGRARA